MISRKAIIGLIVIIMALGLVACDSSSTPGPNNNPSGAPTSRGVPSPPPQTNAPVVTFVTTGGVGGAQKLLEISQGKAKYKSGTVTKSQDVDAKAYTTLMQQFTTADFFNLKDSYDKGGVADDVVYTITLQQGTRTKTVKVAQVGGKDLTPKSLQDVITQLNNIQSTIAK